MKDIITHLLAGDWNNELPPTSSMDYVGYTSEILWVAKEKKLIAFSHTFFPDEEADNLNLFECIGLGEALGLTWKEEAFIHHATANNSKYPEGTELQGVEITWHRKDAKSIQTLELYEHVRELLKAKKLTAGLKHILLGLLAGYSIEQIKEHNHRVVGEYSEEDKKHIREFHSGFKVFL